MEKGVNKCGVIPFRGNDNEPRVFDCLNEERKLGLAQGESDEKIRLKRNCFTKKHTKKLV